MCGQHNVRTSSRDNIGQNRDKGHTPNLRTEIKILDPSGNRARATGLEGKDSTDHAIAMDYLEPREFKLQEYGESSIILSYIRCIATGLEGKDSTDHAMAMDYLEPRELKLQEYGESSIILNYIHQNSR